MGERIDVSAGELLWSVGSVVAFFGFLVFVSGWGWLEPSRSGAAFGTLALLAGIAIGYGWAIDG